MIRIINFVSIVICLLFALVLFVSESLSVDSLSELKMHKGVLSSYKCDSVKGSSFLDISLNGRAEPFGLSSSNDVVSCDQIRSIMEGSRSFYVELYADSNNVIYQLVIEGALVFEFSDVREYERAGKMRLIGAALFIGFCLLLGRLANKKT